MLEYGEVLAGKKNGHLLIGNEGVDREIYLLVVI